MHETNWQVEKKKILTRLSIAIYKMTDEQLISLLHLFKELELEENENSKTIPTPLAGDIARVGDRQLLIARFFLLINRLTEADLLRFMNRYEQKRFAMLREFPRVPCNFNVDLATEGRAINCFSRDISVGGIFVECCEAFTMGQAVSICFSLPDAHLALKLKGRVVRLEHGGVGIKYESLTSYQIEIIKALIKSLHHQADAQFYMD